MADRANMRPTCFGAPTDHARDTAAVERLGRVLLSGESRPGSSPFFGLDLDNPHHERFPFPLLGKAFAAPFSLLGMGFGIAPSSVPERASQDEFDCLGLGEQSRVTGCSPTGSAVTHLHAECGQSSGASPQELWKCVLA